MGWYIICIELDEVEDVMCTICPDGMEVKMASKHNVNRREFLGTMTAAATFSLVPRNVLGGPGYVAPSDKIDLALIGSGTMGMNMLMSDWLPSSDLHISCVCDPNTDSNDNAVIGKGEPVGA